MPDRPQPTDFPVMDAMLPLAEQFEAARTADPKMAEAEIGELIRLVDNKRAIISGRFQGRDAVFRMFLNPSDDTARREWAELQRLWPQMNSGPFRVTEPLHLSVAGRLLIVAKIEGRPLFKHLRQSDPEGRSIWWPAIAGWLRLATKTSEIWTAEAHSRWISRAKQAAASQPFGELKSIETDILAQLRRIGCHLEGTKWRAAISHGDYHPNNLIVDGDRLTGIDTGGSARLPIYKDMARFLVHMGRRNVNLSGEKMLGVDRQGIAAFVRAFNLNPIEEKSILPFFIGCEALLRVENISLSHSRITRALAMSKAMLADLKKVEPL